MEFVESLSTFHGRCKYCGREKVLLFPVNIGQVVNWICRRCIQAVK